MTAATTGFGIFATAGERRLQRAGAADHVLVGHVGHLLDVGAGGEHPLAAVDDDGTDVLALRGLGGSGPDLLLDLHVEGVHLRPVEPDRPDAVLHLEPYELTHVHLLAWAGCAIRPALCRHPCLARVAASGTMPPVTPGLWLHLGDRASVWPGRHHPLGILLVAGVDELRRPRPQRDRRVGVPLRRRRRRVPAPADRAVAGHLARRAARRGSRHPLRVPRRRAVAARAGAAVQRRQAAPRPVRAGDQRRRDLRAGDLRPRPRRARAAQPGRLRAVRAAQRRGRSRRLRLAGRPAAAASLARHGHLRGAREGDDRAPRPGARGAARHVRRPGHAGGGRLPEGPRGVGGGAAADPPVRVGAGPGRPRTGQLLGLQLDRLLRPAQRLLRRGRPRAAGHRVQAHGAEPARRGARGDPRRGLQPHRRGRGDRSHAELPGAGRPLLLPGRRRRARRPGRRHLLGRDRLRQHRRRVAPVRAAADPRLPALLGDRDARRRLPLRPDVGAHSGRPRDRHDQPLPDRRRAGPRAPAREADRRAVGRVDGRLPGRRVPAAVGRVERPVPRRDPRLLARTRAPASAPSPPGWPARPTCTPTTGARPTPRSTSSPRTTASPCATW